MDVIKKFRKYCETGNIKNAKLTYINNKKTISELLERDTSIFTNTCVFGQYIVVEWLIKLNAKVNLHKLNYLFESLCMFGYVKTASLVHYNYKSYINKNCTFILSVCCQKGHVNVVNYLYDNFIIEEEYKWDEIFMRTCINGYKLAAEWLLSHFPKKIMNNESNYYANIFANICLKGDKRSAEWFSSKFKNIDISYNNHCAFRYSTLTNNIRLTRWLLDKFPDIDIRVCDDIVFKHSCRIFSHKVDLIKLLCDKHPGYHVRIINGIVVDYHIDPPKVDLIRKMWWKEKNDNMIQFLPLEMLELTVSLFSDHV